MHEKYDENILNDDEMKKEGNKIKYNPMSGSRKMSLECKLILH